MIKFTLEPSTPIITVDIGSKCVTCGTHTQPNAVTTLTSSGRTGLPWGTYTFTTIEAEAEGSITYTSGPDRKYGCIVDIVTLKGSKCGPCQLVEFKLKQEEN